MVYLKLLLKVLVILVVVSLFWFLFVVGWISLVNMEIWSTPDTWTGGGKLVFVVIGSVVQFLSVGACVSEEELPIYNQPEKGD